VFSNVKSTFFKDRKLSFSCFRPGKNLLLTFSKPNSGSNQNVFVPFSKLLEQKVKICFVSTFFFSEQKVLFRLLKTYGINGQFHFAFKNPGTYKNVPFRLL
jgi:hypothetical protein